MGDIKTILEDSSAYLQVFGSLMKDSTLVDDLDRPLQREDFDTHSFYKLLYVAIYNIHMNGAQIIDEYAVDSYLKNYPEQYKIFNDNQGLVYLSKAIERATLDNYDMYYHKVRKLSLLRFYDKKGYDIKNIYNYTLKDNEFEKEQMKFEEMSEQDIVDYVENNMVLEPRTLYCANVLTENKQAGDGLQSLVDSFLESPDYGYEYTSIALSSVVRGAIRGRFYLFSAGTGTGKTRNFLMNATHFSVPYVWDKKENKFVFTGQSVPTLFVGTEGSIDEFQTIVLAAVSGVDESHIRKGLYKEGEYERIVQATEYIEASPLYLVYCDDYSITDIENIAKRYVLTYKIEIFIFDYLQSSMRLTAEIANNSKVRMQEWQILLIFSTRMKALAQRLDICIISGTQLSAEANDARYKDNLVLQGSKAIAQKVDVGIVISRPNPAETKKIEALTRNMINVPEINMLYWIYKIRGGELSRIILCTNINLGTMTIRDCFITDFDFNLIDVDITKIELVEKMIEENSIDIADSGLRDTLPKVDENVIQNNKFDW